MEMSDGDPYTFSDDTELVSKSEQISSENHLKSSDLNSPLHNSPMAIEPLTPSSTSSSVDSNTEMNVCKAFRSTPPVVANNMKAKFNKTELKPKSIPVLKKKKNAIVIGGKMIGNHSLPAALQQLELSMHGNKIQYLLPKVIDESDDEDLPSISGGLSPYISPNPLHHTIDSPRASKMERSKREFRHRYLQMAQMIDAEEKVRGSYESSLANKLVEAARRYPNETGLLLQGRDPKSSPNGSNPSSLKIFSKRRCSFRRSNSGNSTTETGCPEFCLPCSTLCNRHILYSVDQQLFEFCSARGVLGKFRDDRFPFGLCISAL